MVYKGHLSTIQSMQHGLLHGSVLGLILFALYYTADIDLVICSAWAQVPSVQYADEWQMFMSSPLGAVHHVLLITVFVLSS